MSAELNETALDAAWQDHGPDWTMTRGEFERAVARYLSTLPADGALVEAVARALCRQWYEHNISITGEPRGNVERVVDGMWKEFTPQATAATTALRAQAPAGYPDGVTAQDHIAHDMRMGRFPNRSTLEQFLIERELLPVAEAENEILQEMTMKPAEPSRRVTCGKCEGSGWSPSANLQCNVCGGLGYVLQVERG